MCKMRSFLMLSAVLGALVWSSTAAPVTPVQVPRQKLNDGNEIPTLALGTFLGFNDKELLQSNGEVTQAVKWALDAGYRHIDTAHIYNDEDEVGRGVNEKIADGTVRREDVFVTTKLWNDKHEKDQVVPALRESLRKMGLDYVDLYLIHWPMGYSSDGKINAVDYLDTWAGMEEAKRLGLAKSIGVSNFNEQQLERLISNSNVKPAVLQVEVNPNLTQRKLVQFAQDHGIVVMAYSPFGSLIPSRVTAESPPPRIDDPTLVAIANKYHKTTPQIVLRYLVERGVVPIPKSINKTRIEQNVDIFDFQLTPEEVERIGNFNRDHRYVSPLFWQDHPFYPFEKQAVTGEIPNPLLATQRNE